MTGHQILVCQDYDGERSIDPVIGRIEREGALVSHVFEDVPHWRDRERSITTHYITFDAGRLRNTEAHGIGCRYGFVCHVQQPRREDETCDRGTPGCSVLTVMHSTCETY